MLSGEAQCGLHVKLGIVWLALCHPYTQMKRSDSSIEISSATVLYSLMEMDIFFYANTIFLCNNTFWSGARIMW